jgi:uncharacterized protein YjbJ (UPF0337 family)
MNTIIIRGNLNEFSGKLKQGYGFVTGSRWMMIKGKRQEITGRLQQKYGRMTNGIRKYVSRLTK